MRVFTLSMMIAATALFIAGCSNTLDGAGEDIEHWGETVQETF